MAAVAALGRALAARLREAVERPGRRCSASCRAACIPSCAGARPRRSWPWTFPAMPSAGWPSAKATTSCCARSMIPCRRCPPPSRATSWAWARRSISSRRWRAASTCSIASCPRATAGMGWPSPGTARSTCATPGTPTIPRRSMPASACPAARDYSRAYLHHLVKSGEYLGSMLLSWANTAFYQDLMAAMRDAIADRPLRRLGGDETQAPLSPAKRGDDRRDGQPPRAFARCMRRHALAMQQVDARGDDDRRPRPAPSRRGAGEDQIARGRMRDEPEIDEGRQRRCRRLPVGENQQVVPEPAPESHGQQQRPDPRASRATPSRRRANGAMRSAPATSE